MIASATALDVTFVELLNLLASLPLTWGKCDNFKYKFQSVVGITSDRLHLVWAHFNLNITKKGFDFYICLFCIRIAYNKPKWDRTVKNISNTNSIYQNFVIMTASAMNGANGLIQFN